MNKSYEMINYTLSQIMTNVKQGEYVIPNFQRDYVWTPKKISDLLKSIKNGFPIGIFTMSAGNGSIFSAGKNEIIDNISSNKPKGNWIIVDGQQRLTSLTVVYFAPELNKMIASFSKDTKKLLSKSFKEIVFWNDKFLTRAELKEKFEEQGWESSLINERLRDASIANPETSKLVKQEINQYKIHVLRLDNWTNEDVINIFTAMNKGAKPLTHVDLMNGSIYNLSKNQLDLLLTIKTINKSYEKMGKIKPEFMVQLMKLYFDLNVLGEDKTHFSKKELLKFSQGKKDVLLFEDSLPGFKKALHDSLSILDTKLGFYSIESLPKNVYLIVVLAIVSYTRCGTNINSSILKKSISWITRRLILGDYASSPGVKSMEDVNNVVIPLCKDINATLSHSRIDDIDLVDEEHVREKVKEISYKQKNGAIFKLLTSILSRMHPRNFLSPGEVPVRPTEVTAKNIDLHHFIPKKSDFSEEWSIPDKTINSIGNIALITDVENRNEIRNSNLNDYIAKSQQVHKDDFLLVLKSHLFELTDLEELLSISSDDSSVVVHSKIEDFFKKRAEKLADRIYKDFIK